MAEDQSTASERFLMFARHVYEDHRDRHERTQRVALGMLAFNGVLLALIGANVWQASSSAARPVPTGILWMLAVAMVLIILSISLLIVVVTRVQISWPDLPKLYASVSQQPQITRSHFLAGIYARAVDHNDGIASHKFRQIAGANYLCVAALMLVGLAVLLRVVTVALGW